MHIQLCTFVHIPGTEIKFGRHVFIVGKGFKAKVKTWKLPWEPAMFAGVQVGGFWLGSYLLRMSLHASSLD